MSRGQDPILALSFDSCHVTCSPRNAACSFIHSHVVIAGAPFPTALIMGTLETYREENTESRRWGSACPRKGGIFLATTGPQRLPLRKIINEQSRIRIEKSCCWSKLRTIAQKPASQISLRNFSGEAGFSAQFYVLSEQRTFNKSGRHFFKVSKNRPAHTQRVSMALAPEKGGLSSKEDQRWHPRRRSI